MWLNILWWIWVKSRQEFGAIVATFMHIWNHCKTEGKWSINKMKLRNYQSFKRRIRYSVVRHQPAPWSGPSGQQLWEGLLLLVLFPHCPLMVLGMFSQVERTERQWPSAVLGYGRKANLQLQWYHWTGLQPLNLDVSWRDQGEKQCGARGVCSSPEILP